jgi:hypothetical protein
MTRWDQNLRTVTQPKTHASQYCMAGENRVCFPSSDLSHEKASKSLWFLWLLHVPAHARAYGTEYTGLHRRDQCIYSQLDRSIWPNSHSFLLNGSEDKRLLFFTWKKRRKREASYKRIWIIRSVSSALPR